MSERRELIVVLIIGLRLAVGLSLMLWEFWPALELYFESTVGQGDSVGRILRSLLGD